jgi:hypothetical protein
MSTNGLGLSPIYECMDLLEWFFPGMGLDYEMGHLLVRLVALI